MPRFRGGVIGMMDIEKQIVSFELAKRLKELGLKQESYFHWYETNKKYVHLARDWSDIPLSKRTFFEELRNEYSAFTVAELGELLSKSGVYFSGKDNLESEYEWFCTMMSMPEFEYWQERFVQANTEADARAKMLIYLLENKFITL